MAEDTEQVEGQNLDPAEDQTSTENTEETQSQESSPDKEDWQGKARAYEVQLARQEERNRYLEQTARLLEENSRRNIPQPVPDSLSPELTELDRTLDPLFSKRIKGQFEPLQSAIAEAKDGLDAVRFETYLTRNNPDVFDNEDSLNRVYQQVEQIRQQAAQLYGKYLTRVDAYTYLQGLEASHTKKQARQTKKSTQLTEEAKRQLQNQAAKGGDNKVDAKKVEGGNIDAIRRRAMAGERLTPVEKAAFKKHLENAQF